MQNVRKIIFGLLLINGFAVAMDNSLFPGDEESGAAAVSAVEETKESFDASSASSGSDSPMSMKELIWGVCSGQQSVRGLLLSVFKARAKKLVSDHPHAAAGFGVAAACHIAPTFLSAVTKKAPTRSRLRSLHAESMHEASSKIVGMEKIFYYLKLASIAYAVKNYFSQFGALRNLIMDGQKKQDQANTRAQEERVGLKNQLAGVDAKADRAAGALDDLRGDMNGNHQRLQRQIEGAKEELALQLQQHQASLALQLQEHKDALALQREEDKKEGKEQNNVLLLKMNGLEEGQTDIQSILASVRTQNLGFNETLALLKEQGMGHNDALALIQQSMGNQNKQLACVAGGVQAMLLGQDGMRRQAVQNGQKLDVLLSVATKFISDGRQGREIGQQGVVRELLLEPQSPKYAIGRQSSVPRIQEVQEVHSAPVGSIAHTARQTMRALEHRNGK
ncbi:MAG TPA: hypothetical protein VGT41_01905 [Candidatus Babeliales bacterium]|nr:hypothetical protein [Candidatus Babeliales bacterium]